MASKVASEAANLDRRDPIKVEEQIYDAYADQLRLTLANTMLRYRFPRLFALKQRFRGAPNLHLMPNALRSRMDLAKIWKQLAVDGADDDTIAAHLAELSDVSSTIQGDSFIEYISRNAADLQATV
jgi:hypothetical protein